MTNAETKKPKTIGVTNDVWRELKLLAMEREETLSETIDFLLKQAGAEDEKPDSNTGRARAKAGAKP